MKTYVDAPWKPLFGTESEERRLLPLGNLNVRQQGETGVRGRILEGLAMPVNSLSEDLGGFRERVAPEAMQEALEDDHSDIVALLNHRADHILGRQRAGTLTVWEDYDGLRYRARLAETGIARMVAESVRRGDMTGSSIGFIVGYDSWAWENGIKVRTIEHFKKIVELGPATFPSFSESTVSVRAREKVRELSSTTYAEARQRNRERKMRHGLMTHALRADGRRCAVHEAGHAVAAVLRGVQVNSVMLRFDELQPGVSWELEGGTCHYQDKVSTSDLDLAVVVVAGDVAELLDGYKRIGDLDHTYEYREAVRLHGKPQTLRARNVATKLLTAQRGAVEAVAGALLKGGKLSGARATRMIREARQRASEAA